MSTDAIEERPYLASLVLAAAVYEAELDREFLLALDNEPSPPGPGRLTILPGPPNRHWFVDSFLADLRAQPQQVEILATEEEFRGQLEVYEEGVPDPANPAGRLHALALAFRLELAGETEGHLHLREFPDGDLVLVNLAFAPTVGRQRPELRRFLLELAGDCPLLLATLGHGLDALLVEPAAGGPWLELPLNLAQLARVASQPGRGPGYDFIFLAPAATGGTHPLVLDRLGPPHRADEAARLGSCRDLEFVGEIQRLAGEAERAYTLMYDSARPKDDRDDALGHLARAAELARVLGLEWAEEWCRKRHAHVEAVFNAQFRSWR